MSFDHLRIAQNDKARKALQKANVDSIYDELILYSNHVNKINKKHKSQQRILVITNIAIYNFTPGSAKSRSFSIRNIFESNDEVEYKSNYNYPSSNNVHNALNIPNNTQMSAVSIGQLKRRILIKHVHTISVSAIVNEIVLHIPNEYDYLYRVTNKVAVEQIVRVLNESAVKLNHSIKCWIFELNNLSMISDNDKAFKQKNETTEQYMQRKLTQWQKKHKLKQYVWNRQQRIQKQTKQNVQNNNYPFQKPQKANYYPPSNQNFNRPFYPNSNQHQPPKAQSQFFPRQNGHQMPKNLIHNGQYPPQQRPHPQPQPQPNRMMYANGHGNYNQQNQNPNQNGNRRRVKKKKKSVSETYSSSSGSYSDDGSYTGSGSDSGSESGSYTETATATESGMYTPSAMDTPSENKQNMLSQNNPYQAAIHPISNNGYLNNGSMQLAASNTPETPDPEPMLNAQIPHDQSVFNVQPQNQNNNYRRFGPGPNRKISNHQPSVSMNGYAFTKKQQMPSQMQMNVRPKQSKNNYYAQNMKKLQQNNGRKNQQNNYSQQGNNNNNNNQYLYQSNKFIKSSPQFPNAHQNGHMQQRQNMNANRSKSQQVNFSRPQKMNNQMNGNYNNNNQQMKLQTNNHNNGGIGVVMLVGSVLEAKQLNVPNKEAYLPDKLFWEVFKMTKQQFYNLRPWKQKQLKRDTGFW